MSPNENFSELNYDDDPEYLSFKIAIAASTVATFIDAVSIFATVQGLKETVIANEKLRKYQEKQELTIRSMQQEIDELKSEILRTHQNYK